MLDIAECAGSPASKLDDGPDVVRKDYHGTLPAIRLGKEDEMSKRTSTHEPVSLNFPKEHLKLVAEAAIHDDAALSIWIIKAAVVKAAETLKVETPDLSQYEIPDRAAVAAAAAARGLTINQFMALTLREAVRSSIPPKGSGEHPTVRPGSYHESNLTAAEYVRQSRKVS
jgi:uncharacterized protein (DUF1778 family)